MAERLEIVPAPRPDDDNAPSVVFATFGGRRYMQIVCDCDQSMRCPQGKIGMSPRCRIWKEVSR